jgi:hypothetical protein
MNMKLIVVSFANSLLIASSLHITVNLNLVDIQFKQRSINADYMLDTAEGERQKYFMSELFTIFLTRVMHKSVNSTLWTAMLIERKNKVEYVVACELSNSSEPNQLMFTIKLHIKEFLEPYYLCEKSSEYFMEFKFITGTVLMKLEDGIKVHEFNRTYRIHQSVYSLSRISKNETKRYNISYKENCTLRESLTNNLFYLGVGFFGIIIAIPMLNSILKFFSKEPMKKLMIFKRKKFNRVNPVITAVRPATTAIEFSDLT